MDDIGIEVPEGIGFVLGRTLSVPCDFTFIAPIVDIKTVLICLPVLIMSLSILGFGSSQDAEGLPEQETINIYPPSAL